MEIIVRGKNLEVTPALRSYVEKHTDKIQRYFDKPVKINALLRISNMTETCEVTVFVDGVILRGVEYKTRIAKRFKSSQVFNKQFYEAEKIEEKQGEFEIVRTKHFTLSPMSPEEAILQMNLLGHSFFMFINAETDESAVVYRRNDGKYGLIEADN